MSIIYKNNEINISPSEQKFNVDVVYARPEDTIKLDFALDGLKITFVNGDVDIIFPNGSVISLASYATLAFDSNAPKIYDVNGNLITLEVLLQKVQVLKPEDSILILANRDKVQLVQNQEEINKIIMAEDTTSSEDASGVPISAVGETPIRTKGVLSNIIDPAGTSYSYNLNSGMGDYQVNRYTTFLKGNTDTDNRLPGNTIKEEQPKLVYNFLFGDIGVRGGNRTINGQVADYYGVQFGGGDNKDPKFQLNSIEMNGLGGGNQNKIFDSHAFDGKIKRTLHLDYSGGIFPQGIIISGIPKDLDSSGQKVFNLVMLSGGSTKINYDASKNVYYLTQLDPVGKIRLQFIFNDNVPDQSILIKYSIIYFDPRTSNQNIMESTQDVGIRIVSQPGDLNLNSTVINKGASGLLVDANNAGTGNKIFIGGNVKNEFHSRAGNSLVFTGAGNDTINLESGNNLIYGSTGYKLITGSGNKGINWLVFSNENKYNNSKYFNTSVFESNDNKPFLESDAVKANYYNTLKKGMSLQFYLGVPKDDVLALWDKLGITGSVGGLKSNYTSNFVRTFSSITVIGDRDGSISITNIVSSQGSDTFNLYFQGVVQKVCLYGFKSKTIIGHNMVFHTIKGNDILLNYGHEDMSTVLSKDGAAYSFQTTCFNRFTAKGSGDFTVKLAYGITDPLNNNSLTQAYFVGGEGNNLADFSNIKFIEADKGGINFQADSRYGDVIYRGVKGKSSDVFQNFNHIIGSSGNDWFFGSTNSKHFIFDGYKGNNTLTYERSIGGVTFDALENKIYKVNSKNIEDYSKYKSTADQFLNIQNIILSGLNNVVLCAGNYHIGKNIQLTLGGSNNTIKYDYDLNITSIEVFSDELQVIKDGDSDRKDVFKKNNNFGVIEYIGTKGTNIFHGGIKYANVFNGGKGSDNTLSYQKYLTDASKIITVDLFKNTVFKSGKTDTYINIQKIFGGAGDDIFTLGNIDPTSEDLKKINDIVIDGGGGNNIFRFNGVNTTNLTKDNFALLFDVESGKVKFYSKDGKEIPLSIDLTKNISTIYGTLAKNKFIASENKDFNFDGSWLTTKYEANKSGANTNTLDYSNFTNNLIVNLTKNIVIKSESHQDRFKNIQTFITGKGNDTFLAVYSLEMKLFIFDGNKGENTLEYQNTYVNISFDFSKGEVTLNQESSGAKHYFIDIVNFFGGGGENIFKIYDGALPFLSEKRDNGVTIKLGSKIKSARTIIDFDYWNESIGTAEKPYEINAGQGKATHGKEGADSVNYVWEKSDGFVGSKKGSYFIIVDKNEGMKASAYSFKLDGNKDAKESVLDYSGLKMDNLNLELNIAEGTVLKYTKTTGARDSISNFKIIKLSNYDDTVKLSDAIKDNLKDLQMVDGMGGRNTLDFSMLSKDLDIEITKQGLNLSKLEGFNISFVNFSKMFATKGNTVFKITDNSRGANVEVSGNINLSNNKYTILDLTALKDIEYWYFVESDNPKDPSNIGKLTWNKVSEPITYIKATYISQVKLGEGHNTIYGSLYNHTHYIGSNAEGTNNIIDYSYITKDNIVVTIDGDKQTAWFQNRGLKDSFTNFNYFKTTGNNDTFVISSLEKVSFITLDAFGGDNNLSFSSFNHNLELDISADEIKIKESTIKIIKIQHLILSQNNDTILINNPNKKDLIFKTIDGYKGTNTIDVKDGSTIIFNEKNDNKLLLSQHNEIKISNIYHLKTNSVTGNRFYNNFSTSMKFEVVGITEDKVINLLSYKTSAGVEINFHTCEVYKGGNSIDKFAGINYFEGSSTLVNTYYLAKSLGGPDGLNSNAALKTIYINVDPNNPDNKGPNKDIIDISKIGDNAILYIATKKIEGSEILYKWNNVGCFNFTNNQTIYVSFDESYKYKWVEGTKKDNIPSNTTLVFSTKEGKDGKEYVDGYIIVDSTLGQVETYDGYNKKLANINFSNVTCIKGTGSVKDIFYGSIYNIEYYSSEAVKKGTLYKINSVDGTYGVGTLSYQKFLTEYGMKFIFNADNSATITEDTKGTSKKLDKAYGFNKYIGSMKDDSFVIAKNKNAGKIILDGNGGLFNNINFSQTSGDKGIELDTTTGISLGEFDYIFKHITTFKLTCNSDTVLGSLDNKGFLTTESKEKSTDVIIDANGGTDNTLDYSKYLKGTKDNIIKINADLNLATISKEGKNKDGVLINSNDVIALLDPETKLADIKFQKIILSGEYVSNILTVSSRESEYKIYVEIKNPTESILQLLNFEFVKQNIDIVWDGQNISSKSTNIILATLNGKHLSFIGFNSFSLTRLNSTLTIKENANLIARGGKLDGGGGNNTLIIDNNKNNNSSIVINTYKETISINLKGEKECIYSLNNFQAFYLGCMSNKFLSNELSSYNITFTNTSAHNEVNFTDLNNSYLVLDFKQITNDGANVVISKEDINDGRLLSKDTIYNVNNIVLTNYNDTVELVESKQVVSKKITIDGGKGINTISFKNWDKEVDLSKIKDKGDIEVDNYILRNFTEIILRDKNDEIILNEKSKFNIDGGGGTNKVTYTGDFTIGNNASGLVVLEYEKVKQGNAIVYGTQIIKSNGNIDNLLRFNYFILPQDYNNTYIAKFINVIPNNPVQYTIDFNWKNKKDNKLINCMDYSKLLSKETVSIYVTLDSSKLDNLLVDVIRNNQKTYSDFSNCIKDKLLNVNCIQGTIKGGDIFNISGLYNTNCILNAFGTKQSTINLISENSKRDKDNTTIWYLSDNIKRVTNTSQEGDFLRFNGNITNILITSKPKNNGVLDQEFIISNCSIDYNIIYAVEGETTNTSPYAKLNLQNMTNGQGVHIQITIVADCYNNIPLVFKTEVSAPNSANSKTLRMFGVDCIKGSNFEQNNFKLNYETSSITVKRGLYIIGNSNSVTDKPDSLTIVGGSYLKAMHMYADDKSGSICLVNVDNKQINCYVKYIRYYHIHGVENFVFNVTNSKVFNGNTFYFNFESESKFTVNLTKEATDLKGILDVSGLYFNSVKLGFSFLTNKIDVLTGVEGVNLTILVRKTLLDRDYYFDIFNTIDFTEYNLEKSLYIGDSPSTGSWFVTVGTLKFVGKNSKTANIFMPGSRNGLKNDINLCLTYNATTIFDKIDVYLNNRTDIKVSFANTKLLDSYIIISNSTLSVASQYKSVSTPSKGIVNFYNYSTGDMTFVSEKDIVYHIDINTNKRFLDNTYMYFNKLENIKEFYVNVNQFPAVLGAIVFSSDEIWFHNGTGIGSGITIKFGDSTDIYLFKNNIKFRMNIQAKMLVNFVDSNFVKQYIDMLVKYGQDLKGSMVIQSSDPNLYLVEGKNEYSSKIEYKDRIDYSLYYNENGTVNFSINSLANGVTGNLYINGFKIHNVHKALGCASYSANYLIYDITAPVILSGLQNKQKMFNASVNFLYKENNKFLDVQGANLEFQGIYTGVPGESGSYFVYGVLKGHSVMTQDIITFNCEYIKNYKSFTFNTEVTMLHKSPLKIIAPKCTDPTKMGAITSPNDLTNFIQSKLVLSYKYMAHQDSNSFLNIEKEGYASLRTYNDNDVTFHQSKYLYFNSYHIKNITTYQIVCIQGKDSDGHYINRDSSYIICVEGFNLKGIQCWYLNMESISYVKGVVQKLNSDKKHIYDLLNGFTRIILKESLLVNIFITKDQTPFDSYLPKQKYQSDITIEGEGLTKVFINLEDINSTYNNSFVELNNIKDLQFISSKAANYEVFFVNNHDYCNKYNSISFFNTNGYFVILDNNTNMKIYFTGKNLEKFSNVFQSVSSKQYIKILNDYQELTNVINNPSLKTDILINDNIDNLDDIPIKISYENNNYSSNIFFIDEEEEEDQETNNTSEEFNSIYQEMQSDSQFNENVKYNNTDVELNILSETEKDNNIFDIDPADVLEFISDDIDNIFNSSVDNSLDNKSISEGNYTINSAEENLCNQEDTDNILETIEEISSVENINIDNYKNNDLSIGETLIYNDPSAKVEDSMNKQNNINGNNFK